jgi:hypothetical protein
LFPAGSDKLLTGNAASVTGETPAVADGDTSKRMCPSPTVIPAPTVLPARGMAKTSEVLRDCPLVGPVRSGPNSELLPKMYGAEVEMLASLKLMLVLAVRIPKLNPAIVTAEGPLLLNCTSKLLPEEPAAAVADCTENINDACPLAGPRKERAIPANKTFPSTKRVTGKLNLCVTYSSNLRCLSKLPLR